VQALLFWEAGKQVVKNVDFVLGGIGNEPGVEDRQKIRQCVWYAAVAITVEAE
jgi:hypothetical protein